MANKRDSPDGEPNPVAYSLHLRSKSWEPSILLCIKAQPPGAVPWSHDSRRGVPWLPGEIRYRPLGPCTSPQSENKTRNRCGCLTTGCYGEFLDLARGSYRFSGETCVMNVVICSLHQVFLGKTQSNHGGWGGWRDETVIVLIGNL